MREYEWNQLKQGMGADGESVQVFFLLNAKRLWIICIYVFACEFSTHAFNHQLNSTQVISFFSKEKPKKL